MTSHHDRARSELCARRSGNALPLERFVERAPGVALDLPQVALAAETFRVDLVDILGAGRARREPAAVGDDLDAAEGLAVALRAYDKALLIGQTTAVLGLSNLGRTVASPPKRAAAGGLNFPATYGPQDLATLYDAPASATGAPHTTHVSIARCHARNCLRVRDP